MILYQDISGAFGTQPPPFAGTRAFVVLDGILRCEARTVGAAWNRATIDVLPATSGLITQRDIIASHGVGRNIYINVDVSLPIVDNTAAATDDAADREHAEEGVVRTPGYLPLVVLSKVGDGVPAQATGIQLTGGQDPRDTRFPIVRIADAVNARMGRPQTGMLGVHVFLAANPKFHRRGTWGAVNWRDCGGHTQASWDALILSAFNALSEPKEMV